MNQLTFAQLDLIIQADIKSKIAPILLGMPGIGKSAYLETLASKFKTRVFTIPMNQLADRADLTGARVLEKTDDYDKTKTVFQQEFFPHATIMQAISYAQAHPKETPFLFMDEANRTDEGITSAALSFITLGRIGTMDFPENLRFILAGNDEGNVTSFDKASITRFSIYKIKPDYKTFMKVNQDLNPYLAEVLHAHPNLLTAPVLSDTAVAVVNGASQDPDYEEDEDLTLSAFATDDNSSFDQLTVPRTITKTSDWLNHLGLDKTGSQEELAQIDTFLSEETDGSESQPLLMSALIGHLGNTELMHLLYESISNFYETAMATSPANLQSNDVAAKFRPDQDVINKLSHAVDSAEIEDLLSSMSEDKKEGLLVWLMVQDHIVDVNNTSATTLVVSNLIDSLKSLNSAISGFQEVIARPDSAAPTTIETFKTKQSPLALSLKGLISMVFP